MPSGCLRTWHDGVLRHGPAAGPAAARAARSSAVWVACRRRMGFPRRRWAMWAARIADLGRHTTDVDAGAADGAALNQRDLRALSTAFSAAAIAAPPPPMTTTCSGRSLPLGLSAAPYPAAHLVETGRRGCPSVAHRQALPHVVRPRR